MLRYTYIAYLVSIQTCSQDSSVGIVTAGEPSFPADAGIFFFSPEGQNQL